MSYANLSQKHVSQKVYFMKININFQTIFVLGRVVRDRKEKILNSSRLPQDFMTLYSQ